VFRFMGLGTARIARNVKIHCLGLVFVCVWSSVPERANKWVLWASEVAQDFVKWVRHCGHSFQVDVGLSHPRCSGCMCVVLLYFDIRWPYAGRGCILPSALSIVGQSWPS